MDTKSILERFELALIKNTSLSLKHGSTKIDLYAGKNGFYWVCWYEGGRRQKFGTKRPENALEKIKSLVEAKSLSQQVPQSVVSYERIQELLNLDSSLGGLDIQDFVKFYQRHREISTKLLSEVCELHLQSAKDKSERQRQTLRHHIGKLNAAFPNARINSITSSDLDAYLETYPNLKSRLNHRVTLCSIWAFAQRKNFVPAGLTEAQKSERPKPKAAEPCVMSSEDFTKLLDLCEDRKLAAHLVIAAFAGCRSAEICRLKWKDVTDKYIVLSQKITKTNRRRIANVPENLAKWLTLLREGDTDPVTYTSAHLQKKIKALYKRAGLRRAFNAFRHTFVSCHLEKNCDMALTAKTAGHSVYVLETHYLKLIPKEEAENWFNIVPPEGKTFPRSKPKRTTYNRSLADIVAKRNARVVPRTTKKTRKCQTN
jgi:integrase